MVNEDGTHERSMDDHDKKGLAVEDPTDAVSLGSENEYLNELSSVNARRRKEMTMI